MLKFMINNKALHRTSTIQQMDNLMENYALSRSDDLVAILILLLIETLLQQSIG